MSALALLLTTAGQHSKRQTKLICTGWLGNSSVVDSSVVLRAARRAFDSTGTGSAHDHRMFASWNKLQAAQGTSSALPNQSNSLTGLLLARQHATGTGCTHQVWPSGGRVPRSWDRFKSTIAADAQGVAAGGAAAAGAQAAQAVLVGGESLAAGIAPKMRRQLVWWLGGSAAWVYTMVVLGGITRLTRSGLSMTDWKFTGERPPISQADWEAEFAKYQQSPEFKLIHSRMTLDEFKFIFWMEYAHRMWGRFLGLAFVGPAAYFALRGAITRPLAKRLGLLFFMGGTQGLVGWWMVRSGLQEPEHDWQQVRVSPYRLAGHLVSAFAIFATLTWTACDLATPAPLSRQLTSAAQATTARVRAVTLAFATLVAVTATSGAFVAGMDAGRAYNEFPLMGGQWVPEEYWALWERGHPVRNFFENTAAVQFDHRAFATTTATAALALWAWVRHQPAGVLPRRAVLAVDLVGAITLAQWGLGVWTLLEYVPPHLGSAHQANALNLFTAVLFMLHALRPAQPSARALKVARWATPASMAAIGGVAYAVTQQK